MGVNTPPCFANGVVRLISAGFSWATSQLCTGSRRDKALSEIMTVNETDCRQFDEFELVWRIGGVGESERMTRTTCKLIPRITLAGNDSLYRDWRLGGFTCCRDVGDFEVAFLHIPIQCSLERDVTVIIVHVLFRRSFA